MSSESLSTPLISTLYTQTNWKEQALDSAYTVASYLTDPLCSAHRAIRLIKITDVLYPTSSKTGQFARKALLITEALGKGALSVIATPLGILLRYLGSSLQSAPYLYTLGEKSTEKELSDSLTILSWNLCCVSAGYSISDGGVLPWTYRINSLIQAIQSKDADVVCLYEIFDIQTAHTLIAGLKNSYCHFYYNIGPNVIGPTSGMFVASRVKITDPHFVAFSKEALHGRAKHCKKGVFSFDVAFNDGMLKIFSTHLQHSEIPRSPEKGEIRARREQMNVIIDEMLKVPHHLALLTGDLNLEEREYETSEWRNYFDKGTYDKDTFTWGGDQYCATMMSKEFSEPSTIDHTMILKGASLKLSTIYLETGFESSQFKVEALSDHKGLFSTLKVNHE